MRTLPSAGASSGSGSSTPPLPTPARSRSCGTRRPARPPDRHVAGLGQLEQVLVRRRIPADPDPAARERDERTGARHAGWRVRRARRGGDDAGGQRFATAEALGVDPGSGDAPRGEAGGDLAHEARRAAQVEVAVAADSQRLEASCVEMAGLVEVPPGNVSGFGPAVGDVTPAARQRSDETARVGREGMALAAAGAVQPPDLPLRARRGKRVQHRQHRRRADARADEGYRPFALRQDETAPRRAHLEHVARAHPPVQVSARRPGRRSPRA